MIGQRYEYNRPTVNNRPVSMDDERSLLILKSVEQITIQASIYFSSVMGNEKPAYVITSDVV